MNRDTLMLNLLVPLFFLLCSIHIRSQAHHFDSDSSQMSVRMLIPSTSLITVGLLTNRQATKEKLQDAIFNTSTTIDDYLQFVPTGQVTYYLLSHASWSDKKYQLQQYFIGVGGTLAMTYGLKQLTAITRPNGRSRAFPSGHTSFAFSSATVAYHILQESNPFWAWVSYVPAAATGILRVANDDHWVPDVLMGAGLGILTTQLAYLLFPQKSADRSQSIIQRNIHFDIGPASISIVYSL